MSKWKTAEHKDPHASTLLRAAVALECDVNELLHEMNEGYDLQIRQQRNDEADCLARWRTLSADDRAWLLGTLSRMQEASSRRREFSGRPETDRRRGKDRRAS